MNPRRQLRRVTKTDVDYKEDDNSGPSEDEGVSTHTKKRTKATSNGQKKVTRRKKGKLSRLPDMPLDVLYEVTFGQPKGVEGY